MLYRGRYYLSLHQLSCSSIITKTSGFIIVMSLYLCLANLQFSSRLHCLLSYSGAALFQQAIRTKKRSVKQTVRRRTKDRTNRQTIAPGHSDSGRTQARLYDVLVCIQYMPSRGDGPFDVIRKRPHSAV